MPPVGSNGTVLAAPCCRCDPIRGGYLHGVRGAGQGVEKTEVPNDSNGELHKRVSRRCFRAGKLTHIPSLSPWLLLVEIGIYPGCDEQNFGPCI